MADISSNTRHTKATHSNETAIMDSNRSHPEASQNVQYHLNFPK